MKPLWQEIHDGMIDDIKEMKERREYFDSCVKKHIHDGTKNIFIYLVKLCDYKIKKLRQEYKQKYGSYPRPSQLK